MTPQLWLKQRRKQLGISQEELAAKLQLAGFETSEKSVSHWENGRYSMPLDDATFRNALALSLRMSVYEILVAAGYEVDDRPLSSAGRRAAYIIDRMPEDKREWALDILQKLAED